MQARLFRIWQDIHCFIRYPSLSIGLLPSNDVMFYQIDFRDLHNGRQIV